jgi:hypothetical protein
MDLHLTFDSSDKLSNPGESAFSGCSSRQQISANRLPAGEANSGQVTPRGIAAHEVVPQKAKS